MIKPSADTATKSPARPSRARIEEMRAEPNAQPFSAGPHRADTPSAGAHAADHLTNQDATPGAGALPSHAHGQDVDVGAG